MVRNDDTGISTDTIAESAMNAEERFIARKVTRRGFMGVGTAGALAALAGREPQIVRAETNATADSMIVLWMAGGMSQTETFDPKRYTPFEPGVRTERVLSTFPAIDTSVDHIKISQGLERVARVMDRGSLIRTYQGADLGFILHSRHQYQWHTGYAPPQTVAAPHLGSVIARTLGPLNPAVPAFIDIGQRFDVGEGEELKAFHTAGFLCSEHGPFIIPFPEQAANTVRPPGGMTAARFENRDKFLRKLVAESPVMLHGSDYQRESLLRSLDNAHRLLSSPSAKAFDLTLESPATRDREASKNAVIYRRHGTDLSSRSQRSGLDRANETRRRKRTSNDSQAGGPAR
jgi:hypothetical protein